MLRRPLLSLAALALVPHAGIPPVRSVAPTADGVTVTVVVRGAATRSGMLGAAMFGSADGFPEATDRAAFRQQHPQPAPVDSFVFRNVTPGRYAVAAHHDLDSDGAVDKNFVGAPKEPWGVSRDVRHRLRAPRFDEAAVDVRGDTRIELRVAQ